MQYTDNGKNTDITIGYISSAMSDRERKKWERERETIKIDMKKKTKKIKQKIRRSSSWANAFPNRKIRIQLSYLLVHYVTDVLYKRQQFFPLFRNDFFPFGFFSVALHMYTPTTSTWASMHQGENKNFESNTRKKESHKNAVSRMSRACFICNTPKCQIDIFHLKVPKMATEPFKPNS